MLAVHKPQELVRRYSIAALAESALDAVGPEASQKEIDESTFHHHCEGVYAREYRLPAGHMVIGRVHKQACFNVMLEGRMVITSSELPPKEVAAPQFFISQPGEQKALYAHEDVVFITFHATEETDPDKLLEDLSVPTVKAFESYKRALLTHQENDQ